MIAIVTFEQTTGRKISLCAYDIGFAVEMDNGNTQVSYMAHHDPDVFETAESLKSVMNKVFEAQQKHEKVDEPKPRPGEGWKDGYEEGYEDD